MLSVSYWYKIIYLKLLSRYNTWRTNLCFMDYFWGNCILLIRECNFCRCPASLEFQVMRRYVDKLAFAIKQFYTFLHQKFLSLIYFIFAISFYGMSRNLNGVPYHSNMLPGIEVFYQSFVALISGVSCYTGTKL